MARKKNKKFNDNVVFRLSAEENTLSHMPKYNGYACGTGVHGDTKYNRSKAKRQWRKENGLE